MPNKKNIDELRQKIDQIDEALLDAINERIQLAAEIGRAKEGDGQSIYRPEREAQIFERLGKKNIGPLDVASIRAIFREIISAARAAEGRIKVGVLGPRGTYSEQAALSVFGQQIEIVEASSIKEVFRLTESGEANFGVVPVENSTEGGINVTLDLLVESPLTICNEAELRISHNLLGKAEDHPPLQISGHEQALAQCRNWLGDNYPGITQVAVASNAEAARLASTDPSVWAVASESAASVYGLNIVAKGIEDLRGNTTRFLVLSKEGVRASGKDKTSLVVANSDKAGALLSLLEPLATAGISMTRIESRPMKSQLWRYVFFIDIQGHADDPKVSETLHRLESECAFFRVLGSYPRSS
ncbi:MAG: prephenate dehydratase [Gammaproteobacteria bacterium]